MSPRFAALRLRGRLYALIRQFFAERAVLEVETPILSMAGNTDPNIESFCTEFHGHTGQGARRRWLRTSPEFPLKRLLAEGLEDCYELGRVFRNGEAGQRHNPEFTMLEWYRRGIDHHELAREVLALIQAALVLVGRTATVRTLTYRQWFIEALDIDPMLAETTRLRDCLSEFQIDFNGLGRDDLLDLIITHRLQQARPKDELLVVVDYPASQCALARVRQDDVPVAERFEVLLAGVELANGYHELRDADEQRARFQRDQVIRRTRGSVEPDIDERLLAALPQLPDCAGVALGVDRLLQILLDEPDLRQTLAFDFARA